MEVTASIRLGLAILMLAIASWSDLRVRRVPNHYWSPFVALAIVFFIHDLSAGRLASGGWIWSYGLAIGLCGLWYLLWMIGTFGGADAKGLMVLVLLLPWPLHELPVPPALDAVTNATLFVLVLPVAFLGWNVGRGHVRLPVALLGVRLSLPHAQRRQVWPMERVVEGKVRLRYWQRIGAGLDVVYHDLRRAGVNEVWATPKIPFMVPLLAGLLLAAWRGNLLLAWVLGP